MVFTYRPLVLLFPGHKVAWAVMRSLPRRDVSELSVEEFDEVFYDKLPLILTGSSICPNATLDTLMKCPNIKFENPPQISGKTGWAGMEDYGKKMSLATFVRKMRDKKDSKVLPRYLFDVSAFHYCPELVTSMSVPAHLSTSFINQWAGPWNDCQLPHVGLYLAEKGFETQLHADSRRFAFVASMCEGRKKWRVVTNSEVSAKRTIFNATGLVLNGTLIGVQLNHMPFGIWDSTLGDANIEYYEGLLSPGEVLYVPGDAPHAAATLDDSFMVASNAGSFGAAELLRTACKLFDGAAKEYCDEQVEGVYDDDAYYSAIENVRKYAKKVRRESKPWLTAYRCSGSKYCKELQTYYNGGSKAVRRYCRTSTEL